MHSDSFRRRDFFTLFGGAATIWSLGARAQQAGRVKQIGILTGAAKNELTQSQVRALEFGLQELGWFDGRNLRIEYRWAGGDPDRIHAFAKEIVALTPDLIVGVMTPVVAALKQQTRTIPIVFVGISDPVRSEFVESFSRPGGNITGFTIYETTLGGKWLQLLHELAPSLKRVAMLFNPETANAGASGGVYLQSIEAAAHAMGTELIVTPVHKADEIDGALASIAQEPGGGLIVLPNAFTVVN